MNGKEMQHAMERKGAGGRGGKRKVLVEERITGGEEREREAEIERGGRNFRRRLVFR